MKRLFCLLFILMVTVVVPAHAALLVRTTNGTLVDNANITTLAQAQASAYSGFVITSPLTAVQSNYSSASVHAFTKRLDRWPGGSISPTTKFVFAANTGTEISPELFGGVADAATTGQEAFINKAILATPSGGTMSGSLTGTYIASGPIVANNSLTIIHLNVKWPSTTSGNAVAINSLVQIRDSSFQGPSNANTSTPSQSLVGLNFLSSSAQYSKLENVTLSWFNQGMVTNGSYGIEARNLAISQCYIPFVLGAQTNAAKFFNLYVGNNWLWGSFTNCENVSFYSPEFANQGATAVYGLTLFQSAVTMIAPYMENQQSSAPGLVEVGGNGEASTSPSTLTLIGGQYNNVRNILLHDYWNKVVFKGGRVDPSTGSPMVFPEGAGVITGVEYDPAGYQFKYDIFAQIRGDNYGPWVRNYGGGSGTLTRVPTNSGYVTQSMDTAFRGYTLSGGLTIGNTYTLALTISTDSTTLSVTDGITTWNIPNTNPIAGGFYTAYIPFVAASTSMNLLFNDANKNVNIRDISLYSGYGFPKAIYNTSPVVYGSAAPSTGTWAVGNKVVNNTPTVGQPKAWSCTVAGSPGTWVSEGNL